MKATWRGMAYDERPLGVRPDFRPVPGLAIPYTPFPTADAVGYDLQPFGLHECRNSRVETRLDPCLHFPCKRREELRLGRLGVGLKLCATLLLAACLCGAQDNMAEAIRKGIIEEDVNHNLSAAIQSYNSVVAQYDEDRKSAATALFRIAECYRKLGWSQEAIAAYGRVIREFADQTKLAEQSRNQLSKTYKMPQAPAGGAVSPAMAEARKKYRSILVEGIKAAQFNWDFIEKQFKLGAISELDTYEAQEEMAKFEGRLAAFDAGLTQPLPAGPRTPAALAARAGYKELLQSEVRFASLNLTAVHTKYNLGAAHQNDVVAAQIKLYDAELELAALDAGFAQAPGTPATPGQ